jgi:drug/metabolite transporter superfamily protein YnfA
MRDFAWVFVFLVAAILEVGGDAAIRKGFFARSSLLIVLGVAILGSYGLAVNWINNVSGEKWSLSKMLGVYVAFFAVTSVLADFLFSSEVVPTSTWLGLIVIISGGMVIQFGPKLI